MGLPLAPYWCACGCGGHALPQRKWIRGHRPRPSARMTNGYIRVRRPGHPLANRDGYVLEHRLVLHEAGIEIPPGYNVHHKNGVKDDNRLENLEVLPKDEHHRLHARAAGFIINQYGRWPLRSAA